MRRGLPTSNAWKNSQKSPSLCLCAHSLSLQPTCFAPDLVTKKSPTYLLHPSTTNASATLIASTCSTPHSSQQSYTCLPFLISSPHPRENEIHNLHPLHCRKSDSNDHFSPTNHQVAEQRQDHPSPNWQELQGRWRQSIHYWRWNPWSNCLGGEPPLPCQY